MTHARLLLLPLLLPLLLLLLLLLLCLCCVQARYHPDKVPPSAPLSERVYAEEVSKVLNAHNWGC
jgi:hypothetical protein